MIGMPVRLHRRSPTVQAVPKNRGEFIKLQFVDKVVDISVNVQKLTLTVRVPHITELANRSKLARVQHNDKVVDVLVAVHLKTPSSLQCVPCRKLRKSHIRFFDWNS